MVFGEYGPVHGNEHRAERLVTRLECLCRQCYASLKVSEVGFVHDGSSSMFPAVTGALPATDQDPAVNRSTAAMGSQSQSGRLFAS